MPEGLTNREIDKLLSLLNWDSLQAKAHGKSGKDHALSEAAIWLVENDALIAKLVLMRATAK